MGKRKNRGRRYQARDPEKVKKRAEGGGDFDQVIQVDLKGFTPAEGKNAVRILPPTFDDADNYGIDVYVHYGVGEKDSAYVCPERMSGDKCSICEERHKAERAEDEDYASKLRATRRVLVYLVDRKDHDKLKYWLMPQSVDQEINLLSMDEDTGEVIPVDHPDKGYDITFTRKGKGIGTSYVGVRIARKKSELDNDEALEFADDNPLPDIVNVYSYKYVKKVFHGLGADDDDEDDEEEEERPRRKKKKKGKKKKGKKKKYEDDEDEDEDDDDESEDLSWDDLLEMDHDELLEFAEDEDLDPDDYEDLSEKRARSAIAKELDIKTPKKKNKKKLDKVSKRRRKKKGSR